MSKAASELLMSVPFIRRYIGRVKRRRRLLVLFCAILAVLGGCKKPGSSSEQGANQPLPSGSSLVRIHWLGKKRISAETNATGFMKIWNLPESARLEGQTLDKLALALANQLPGTNSAPITNYNPLLRGASALLRPLLQNLVQEECYFEMRRPPGQPWGFVLAIRLGGTATGLWETNLASAMQVLTGVRSVTASSTPGWQMQLDDLRPLFKIASISSGSPVPQPGSIQLSHAGEWTLVGLTSQDPNIAKPQKSESNPFLAEIRSRIESSPALSPFNTSGTNFWLEVEADLAVLASAFLPSSILPQNLPRVVMTLTGDGENVRTRGQLNFAKPLLFQLEPWAIPTNLLSDSIINFTAIRGLRPWLSSAKFWKEDQIEPPSQIYFWSQAGVPVETFFAAPMLNASNFVSRISERLLKQGNAWLATNAMGQFGRSPDTNGVVWVDAPFMSPFLQSVATSGGEFVLGGLMAGVDTNRPVPPQLLQQLLAQTNLISYDWELTGPRIEKWIYLGQLFRLVFNKAQMDPQSASFAWLKTGVTNFSNCGTVVTRTGASQLSFVRNSRSGFTALELHLLADWLESPDFPHGLHSLSAPVPATSETPAPKN